MSTTLVIVNPAAAAGRAKRIWRRAEPLLRQRVPDFEACFTTAPGEAEHLAAAWGPRHPGGLVVTVGGDGSVHEVVNGLLGAEATCRLGILAAGTGNDIAANLGINPNPLDAAARLSLESHRADVGRAEYRTSGGEAGSRFFLNSLSLGVSARANRIALRLRRLLPGPIRYPISGLLALLIDRTGSYAVTSNGHQYHGGPALNVTIANGARFGGGLRISPESDPWDGALDLVVVGAISRLRALLALSRLRTGAHLRMREVRTVRLPIRVRIHRASGPLRIELDGENLEADSEVRVEIRPGGIEVVGGCGQGQSA